MIFAGPAAPDRGSQRGGNDCASSCLTSAARDGGTGAASASYWSLNERPIAASPTCRSAAGALLGLGRGYETSFSGYDSAQVRRTIAPRSAKDSRGLVH